MKPYTKEVLDVCTELLVEAGLRRKRRGLAIWKLNPEMLGAIKLVHRDFPDGSVMIDTYPQIYWEPVQRIFSIGIGEKYCVTHNPTVSRMWSFINLGAPELIFVPGDHHSPQLLRLHGQIRENVISKVLELANEAAILEHYRDDVPFGGHRPEMYLAIKTWQTRSILLDNEFDWVCSILTHQEFIDSVTAFYDRLRGSPEVAALLT